MSDNKYHYLFIYHHSCLYTWIFSCNEDKGISERDKGKLYGHSLLLSVCDIYHSRYNHSAHPSSAGYDHDGYAVKWRAAGGKTGDFQLHMAD